MDFFVEIINGKVLLIIWHNISKNQLLEFGLVLANKLQCPLLNDECRNRKKMVNLLRTSRADDCAIDIICEYDDKLENFLNDVVQYTINRFGQGLDLSNLKVIELMNISEFELETDGRSCDSGTKIIVTSRLYDKLPSYDIEKLTDNEDFKLIVNTMFHEMGHISDWSRYPNLYSYGSDLECDIKKGLPALFWLEYLAEKRSCQTGLSDGKIFCDDFVKKNWRAYMVSFTNISTDNFLYLNKIIPYFLARTLDEDIRKDYLKKIENQLLVDYVIALWEEVVKLEREMPFDDISTLEGLYEIMNEYFMKFKKEFAPKRRGLFW